MMAEIHAFKEAGADGFIFGMLTTSAEDTEGPDQWVDIGQNRLLIDLAHGLPCTFHRAFDLIPEEKVPRALEAIIQCGFTSILTSGGEEGAVKGMGMLTTMIPHSTGGKIDCYLSEFVQQHKDVMPEIIVGGGVRSSNIEMLRNQTCARAFHSSAITGEERVANIDEVRALKARLQTTAEAEKDGAIPISQTSHL